MECMAKFHEIFLVSVELPEREAINLYQKKENSNSKAKINKVLLLFPKDQTKDKDVTEAGWGT